MGFIKAVLILEDGTVFSGEGFGHPCEVSGEVVFNTGMVGYPESLTDPSYSGQILIQTYPLIGNYGVPPFSLTNRFGIPLHFESNTIKITGYGIGSLSKVGSNWSSKRTLNDWMMEEKIPGITGIDTRELTKKLRTKGVMLGILKVADRIDLEQLKRKAKDISDPNGRDLVREVTVQKPVRYESGGSKNIVLIDCGMKYGILRSLLNLGLDVTRVPYNYSFEKIMELEPDGVVISNGPGDPKRCVSTIETVKELMGTDLPLMGICLGNQIVALAAGADTYKLKFGHRGQNHPCMDLKTKRCYITSQNHGFAVDEKSLEGTGFEVSFVNANDKTVEGIAHKSKPVFAVQFHPEASPGPYETGFLFDKFVEEVKCRSRNG